MRLKAVSSLPSVAAMLVAGTASCGALGLALSAQPALAGANDYYPCLAAYGTAGPIPTANDCSVINPGDIETLRVDNPISISPQGATSILGSNGSAVNLTSTGTGVTITGPNDQVIKNDKNGVTIDTKPTDPAAVRGYSQATTTTYKAGLSDGDKTFGLSVASGNTVAPSAVTYLTGGSVASPSGLMLDQTQALLVGGGPTGSQLTLNANGATFARTTGGYPITVTGVADGVNPFDAVNVRQLQAVSTGVASIAAMSNIPGLDSSKRFNVGIGYGNFQGNSAMAVGVNGRLSPAVTAKASLGLPMSYGNATGGVGLSYAW